MSTAGPFDPQRAGAESTSGERWWEVSWLEGGGSGEDRDWSLVPGADEGELRVVNCELRVAGAAGGGHAAWGMGEALEWVGGTLQRGVGAGPGVGREVRAEEAAGTRTWLEKVTCVIGIGDRDREAPAALGERRRWRPDPGLRGTGQGGPLGVFPAPGSGFSGSLPSNPDLTLAGGCTHPES